MQAEIVAIGSELTSGEKLDTNSQWLSLQLADMGISTLFHTTVADNIDANLQALQLAIERVDVVLVSGGLGPTQDDLTRDVLAKLAGVPLELDAESLAHLEDFFRGRGREMPERNRIQAMFPQGSQPLPNPVGTAPGIWLEVPRPNNTPCLIAAMPGVPSEMYKMFREQVQPQLPGASRCIRRARLNCFGLGESATEEILGDLTARGRDPEVGITAHEATITLRIVAHGADEQECQQKIDTTLTIARQRLGDHAFGVEDEKLEDVVVEMLRSNGQTLATLEWGTAGQLAGRLFHAQGRVLASSGGNEFNPLAGGQVQSGEIEDLQQAAEAWRAHCGANYVLAIGPERVIDEQGTKSTATELLLLTDEGVQERYDLSWNGNPAIRLTRTAKSALDLLRRFLIRTATVR
ncbi:MAG: damage-inducible protein CinA [Planctomycetaceae bacterium]|nr:damage-inducible protein CinA [Planctomycetaceae bacterium]